MGFYVRIMNPPSEADFWGCTWIAGGEEYKSGSVGLSERYEFSDVPMQGNLLIVAYRQDGYPVGMAQVADLSPKESEIITINMNNSTNGEDWNIERKGDIPWLYIGLGLVALYVLVRH